jgi:hypothetical protein
MNDNKVCKLYTTKANNVDSNDRSNSWFLDVLNIRVILKQYIDGTRDSRMVLPLEVEYQSATARRNCSSER